MVESFKEAAEEAKKEGRIADYIIENGDGIGKIKKSPEPTG